MNYKTNDLYIVTLAKKTKHEDGVVSYQELPERHFAIELKRNISISPQARTFRLVTSDEVFSNDYIYKLSGQTFVLSIYSAVSQIHELAQFNRLDKKYLADVEMSVLNADIEKTTPKTSSFNVQSLEYLH